MLALLFLVSAVLFSGCSTSGSVPAGEAAEVWYNLGNAYTELGRNTDAVKAYIKARRLNPQLLSAGFNLARVYIMLEQYDEGLRQLELLLEKDPENRTVLETLAWVYHLNDDDPAALEVYNRVLDGFSGSRNSLYNSALILSDTGEPVEALSRFKRLFELYPEEKSVVFEIALLEAELENFEDSLMWLELRLEDVPDDIAALELAGDMYVKRTSYGEALESYRKILSLMKDNGEGQAASGVEFSAETDGRVSFKVGELLLLYIEDIDGGIEAIQHSLESGWKDRESFDRILENEDAEWYKKVSEMLADEDPSDTEEPASEG